MAESKITTIEGSVEEVVFHSEDTGFTVLELATDEERLTGGGELVQVDIGEALKVTGQFVTHPTYGSQFKAAIVERTLPATSGAILKYLSSGAIKGIGPAIARRLVDAFGDQTLEVIEKQPRRLTEIRGISPKKAEEIEEEYKRIFGIRAVMLFLSRFRIDPAASIRVWKLWGTLATDIISENPYALCCEEIGLKFEEADAISTQLGLPMDSRCRMAGAILYVLRHNTFSGGHCCLPQNKLLRATRSLLGDEELELDSLVDELVEEKSLVSDTVEGQRFLYLPQFYQAETYVAGRLAMMEQLTMNPPEDLNKDIDALEKKLGIAYAKLQRKAIETAFFQDVLILTGGPGTGKTTTLNGIITLLEQRGFKVALAAPTGRAAKRMSEVTGREAKTIHRLLEVDFQDESGKNKFKRNQKNPLPFDAVVVDEMSMVDIQLFESLIKALRLGSKLILVGAPDQLPSVGAGNVLKDLIDSDVIAVVHLSEVFRQAAESLIVTNAHAIVSGELPDLSHKDNDFFFLPQPSSDRAMATVLSLCSVRLPKAYGCSPMWDIQVISPSRVGALGTVELNRQLQQVLNPPSPQKTEFKFGSSIFREGDKVMQIRNNYDIVWSRDDGDEGMGVFNGDIGVIEMIDRPSQSILVRYDDRMAQYVFDMADELDLAYAITVHKSQGSEFESVVMPLMGYHSKLHYRNLLYTGVTRAKKRLILLGQASTVARMVQNDKKTLRYTNLKTYLIQAAGHGEG